MDNPIPREDRRWPLALFRGLKGTCPRCGSAPLFARYVKMKAACDDCALALEPHRADDAPAYFTILVVGHVIVPAMLIAERAFHPATWLHLAIWLPMTLALALVALPRIKGAVVGLQWALDIRRDL